MNEVATQEQAEDTSKAVAVVQPRKAELVAGHDIAPIIPRTIDEVGRIAKAILVAGLAPDSYKGGGQEETASKVIVGIMKGAEVGLPPITALSTIAIINGRPTIWGDGAVALVQKSGHLEKMETTWHGAPGDEARGCTVSIWRKGQDSPYVGSFTMTDAKRARLTGKGPWVSYPDRMLFNRARAFALRDGFADCLSGLSIREEVDDLPPPPKETTADFLNDELPAPETNPEEVQAELFTPKGAETLAAG